MFKSKDFLLMDVLNSKGKNIGFIKDVLIDFNSRTVSGFSISSNQFFKKETTVLREDILAYDRNMIVSKVCSDHHLEFQSLKHMDVIDCKGNILGVTEEILFEPISLTLKGILISSGLLRNILYGKKVLLMHKLILGEKNILYYDEMKKWNFLSLPHSFLKENDNNEKKI